jgi:hypothetical protein
VIKEFKLAMKLFVQCILACICLISFFNVNAQTDTLESKKLHYKHEIGYIIPFGILYRYHFKKNAIRCVLNYKNSVPDFNDGPTLRTKFGYQYNLINKKIKLFVGIDFLYVCSRDRYPHYIGSTNITRYTNMSVGLSPLVGCSYQINKRLSLGLEIASGFFYTWYSHVLNGYFTSYSETHYYQHAYLYSISFNISYHF